jgi:DNA-binding response OmpR family regulator
VVEDDEHILQVIQRGLIFEGYRVDTALNGFEGLAKARENPPDIVILDWMLPKVGAEELDGLEVCRRLRQAGPTPILMLTAKDSVENRVQGLDAGADD